MEERRPLVVARGSGPSAEELRANFVRMTALFALNHGCTVSCLDLANARLGSIGVWQSGILYASYTLSALYGSSYIVKAFGSKNGLVMGMALSAGYVTSFFIVSLVVENNGEIGWAHKCIVVASAVVGGVGASTLWVSQGGYFTSSSQLFASAGGMPVEDATGRFGGNFASSLLFFEVLLRLMSSFFIRTAGMSWKVVFGLYSMLSILPVLFMMSVMDLRGHLPHSGFDEYGTVTRIDEEYNPLPSRNKATATFDLLRADPRARYMSLLNVLFGFSTSFCSSVLNGAIIREVLSDESSSSVGLYTAVTSTVAAGGSLLFGTLQSSDAIVHVGKEPTMTAGASCYLIIACQFAVFPDGSTWTRTSLLMVYVLLGLGRATFEG